MKELPKDFIDMLHDLLQDEADELIESLNQPPITSVRLNKRKPGAEFDNVNPVPWCPSGLYLKERPEFILDPLLHAGAYYVQDASSMVYETVIKTLLSSDFTSEQFKNANLDILDLCAAPGGKTTAMINALNDECHITANDYSQKRIPALKENLAKWGYPDITITNKDSSFFSAQSQSYDIIAVDAPCSGEGMMRKEEMARSQWSWDLVNQCATLQREILKNSMNALKPGGFLIYSTCTFNRKENEENAEFINKDLGLKPINLNFPKEWGIPGGIDTDLPVYRFMPHKTRGEGLFLSVFQKPGIWEETKTRIKNKNLKKEGPELKEQPKVEVDLQTALSYLRREAIQLPDGSPLGLVTITYKGLALGPAKNIGSRANNLYPKNWRILKR